MIKCKIGTLALNKEKFQSLIKKNDFEIGLLIGTVRRNTSCYILATKTGRENFKNIPVK